MYSEKTLIQSETKKKVPFVHTRFISNLEDNMEEKSEESQSQVKSENGNTSSSKEEMDTDGAVKGESSKRPHEDVDENESDAKEGKNSGNKKGRGWDWSGEVGVQDFSWRNIHVGNTVVGNLLNV